MLNIFIQSQGKASYHLRIYWRLVIFLDTNLFIENANYYRYETYHADLMRQIMQTMIFELENYSLQTWYFCSIQKEKKKKDYWHCNKTFWTKSFIIRIENFNIYTIQHVSKYHNITNCYSKKSSNIIVTESTLKAP
jgi:hypothetical protein